MNLKELSSPIRMYWDLGPVTADRTPDYRRICGELVLNKLLFVQVTDLSPSLGEACLTVLEALSGKPPALSLVLSRPALTGAALETLRRFTSKAVFVTVSSLNELEAIRELKDAPVGVSFPVTRANRLELPEVLSFCVENRVARLTLPMQRLMRGEECFYLNSGERRELTARLRRIAKPAGLKIVIHDPFLWRVFYPDVAFPEGGCQAANTMLYISPEADVYPCPSAPIKIGNLTTESLKDIISSGRKKEVRERLLAVPAACASCGELRECKGGCRGRACAVRGDLGGPDPGCP